MPDTVAELRVAITFIYKHTYVYRKKPIDNYRRGAIKAITK